MKIILVLIFVAAAFSLSPAPVQAANAEADLDTCPFYTAYAAGPGARPVTAAGHCRALAPRAPDGSGSQQSSAGVKIYLPSVRMAEALQDADPGETAPDREAETGSEMKQHVVRRGESLAKIARMYETSVEALVLANPQIANPSLIFIGDKVRIPSPDELERLRSEQAKRWESRQRQVVADTPHNGERWVDVDLRSQTVRAYEGDTLVKTFLASTGTARYPTVTGQYRVWLKLEKDDMRGPGYYLKDVPYVMYFHKGYGLHGTYWHDNFGTPMSHGCVNLRVEDAAWLFDFGSVGMLVNVH